jgi:hypothetical protein
LSTWESAAQARGQLRAVALAGATDAAELPLGGRDAQLLRLLREVRGPVLDALAECPECATTLEVQLEIDALLEGYPEAPRVSTSHELDLGGVRVLARCPTTADLIAVAGAPTAADARGALLERCVSAPRPLQAGEIERLGRELERLDPLADVRIDIGCGECGRRWLALLDVPALVWAQVQSAARRMLREVDALAARYGWSEAEILALSEHRRRAYLDLR